MTASCKHKWAPSSYHEATEMSLYWLIVYCTGCSEVRFVKGNELYNQELGADATD